jgi:hypothetical protein
VQAPHGDGEPSPENEGRGQDLHHDKAGSSGERPQAGVRVGIVGSTIRAASSMTDGSTSADRRTEAVVHGGEKRVLLREHPEQSLTKSVVGLYEELRTAGYEAGNTEVNRHVRAFEGREQAANPEPALTR